MYVTGTGIGSVSVAGTNYSAEVLVTGYDDDNTVIGQTTITITGPTSDTPAQMGSKIATAVVAWKANIQEVNLVVRKLEKVITARAQV